jgi:hypothetical protein
MDYPTEGERRQRIKVRSEKRKRPRLIESRDASLDSPPPKSAHNQLTFWAASWNGTKGLRLALLDYPPLISVKADCLSSSRLQSPETRLKSSDSLLQVADVPV